MMIKGTPTDQFAIRMNGGCVLIIAQLQAMMMESNIETATRSVKLL